MYHTLLGAPMTEEHEEHSLLSNLCIFGDVLNPDCSLAFI